MGCYDAHSHAHVCMHTHMSTHTCMHTQVYTHTCAGTLPCACTHMHAHTHVHTCMHSYEHMQLIHTRAHNSGMAQLTCVLAHSHICAHSHVHAHMTKHVHSHYQRTHSATQMHVSPQTRLQLSRCRECSAHRKGGGPAPELGPGISVGRGVCGEGTEPKTEPAAPVSAQKPWPYLHLFSSRPQRRFCKLSLLGS